MADKCKICDEVKTTNKPRFIGNKNIKDPKFNNSILVARFMIMCDECYEDYKIGKINIVDD